MACRGVFFAVPADTMDRLYEAEGDVELMAVIEELEDAWDEDNLAPCDKTWDALHRLLTTGRLDYGNGEYPFSHAVLGPRQLHDGDDYIVSVVEPDEVKDVAVALGGVTEAWFRERYRTVVPRDYALEYGEDDLLSTWDWFGGVRELYAKAAARDRAVVFTVDQ